MKYIVLTVCDHSSLFCLNVFRKIVLAKNPHKPSWFQENVINYILCLVMLQEIKNTKRLKSTTFVRRWDSGRRLVSQKMTTAVTVTPMTATVNCLKPCTYYWKQHDTDRRVQSAGEDRWSTNIDISDERNKRSWWPRLWHRRTLTQTRAQKCWQNERRGEKRCKSGERTPAKLNQQQLSSDHRDKKLKAVRAGVKELQHWQLNPH